MAGHMHEVFTDGKFLQGFSTVSSMKRKEIRGLDLKAIIEEKSSGVSAWDKLSVICGSDNDCPLRKAARTKMRGSVADIMFKKDDSYDEKTNKISNMRVRLEGFKQTLSGITPDPGKAFGAIRYPYAKILEAMPETFSDHSLRPGTPRGGARPKSQAELEDLANRAAQ